MFRWTPGTDDEDDTEDTMDHDGLPPAPPSTVGDGYEVAGEDWSGRPGQRCECCGRRSENVGPRRGFDYRQGVCGGCCELDKMTEAGIRVLEARFAPPMW